MTRKPWADPFKGFRAANSNTRILKPGEPLRGSPSAALRAQPVLTGSPDNLGLTSERLRQRMVERLQLRDIHDQKVLAAMRAVPRHLFVDEALASRAYEDVSLPIGHGQTISQPWVVAHMVSLLHESGKTDKILEVGAGCGYQAAVLARIYKRVYAVERVRPLYDVTKARLQRLGLEQVHLHYGDGMLGWKTHAPYDAIVVAAAGLEIPNALLQQLKVGGRLIAPEGQESQRLVLIVREQAQHWSRQVLDDVRFVPLKPGLQIS
ncbi:protein-L-isoaspartate(D-aspartate) O-methyltransferase [Orrella sp. 11846]|uniref:protein-L-isoaspartate(D-aspartate) O-methyltransferase n=1 Tax=Orrella sp. 11846 TaxID=3409913 RepID=UPI003B5AFFF7